jgi:dGTPase
MAERLESNGKGLNLCAETLDGIRNHSGIDDPATLEGWCVRRADRIAYINHDIDDACRAGILHPEDIPKELREVLGETHSKRINTMVASVIEASTDRKEIAMLPHVQEATDRLRAFLFENIYTSRIVKGEEGKAKEMLGQLFMHFADHPEEMPELYRRNVEEEGVKRCVCDFISGMTDRYAIETYKKLFIPHVWSL